MGNLLIWFAAIILIIVVAGIINDRTLKLPNDIAIVLFAFSISIILKILMLTGIVGGNLSAEFANFRFEEYLMDGVLCFMLFSGASKMHFSRFVGNLRSISLLALLSTVISSVLYGAIFWVINYACNFGMNIWMCILLGCIVSPTDPIAATGILNKLGLSKNVTAVIEGESLFNDGTGVALFICIKNIVTNTSELSLPLLLCKELLGAVAVGFIVSFLLFRLLKFTKDPIKHILISLLAVSLIYIICEHFGFSGVIASVVCGIYFSRETDKIHRWRAIVDNEDLYDNFWDIADNLLNSILFVLIGASILYIPYEKSIFILIPAAIIINLIARYAGVFSSTWMIGNKHIPNRYSKNEFTTLMTWSALKGGLSLALALTTSQFLSAEHYRIVLIVTCTTMFFTIIIQGLTTSKIYRFVETKKANRLTEKSTVNTKSTS